MTVTDNRRPGCGKLAGGALAAPTTTTTIATTTILRGAEP